MVVPLSRKILISASLSLALTLFMIQKQRQSPYILQLASDRALAGRALFLGTAAACSGVGVLMGLIATLTGAESFLQFREKTDNFFIRHNIKNPPEPGDHTFQEFYE
jgi:hypothetical protein